MEVQHGSAVDCSETTGLNESLYCELRHSRIMPRTTSKVRRSIRPRSSNRPRDRPHTAPQGGIDHAYGTVIAIISHC